MHISFEIEFNKATNNLLTVYNELRSVYSCCNDIANSIVLCWSNDKYYNKMVNLSKEREKKSELRQLQYDDQIFWSNINWIGEG